MLIPTLLIGLTVVVCSGWALLRFRDTFHPAVLMGPMLAFHYCFSPLFIASENGFWGYLTEEHLAFAQWVHLTGVLALCAGLSFGSLSRATSTSSFTQVHLDRTTLVRGAVLLGCTGLASFLYGIANVGGFGKAYGTAYGGGWSDSGWVRDLVLLCLPALFLLTIAQPTKTAARTHYLLMAAFASPFLIHGILGARRGPTFMGIAGTAMVLYMAKRLRPRLLTLVAGGALLGLLMLSLVVNRNSVHLGSELDLNSDASGYFTPGTGNDFIYGAGLVVVSHLTKEFGWGASYATTLFVRPVPRAIWPTKYEDAAAFFNTPNLEVNLGVDIDTFRSVLGWTAAIGAAPGIVGDLWREFSWGMVIALFLLGWLYSGAWRRAVRESDAWVPIYCFLASLSIYLVMQTLEAMLYRFVLGLVPMLLVLRRARLRGAMSGGAAASPPGRPQASPTLTLREATPPSRARA